MQNEVVSRQSWLQARAELLVKEKAHTRARAELAAARRQLPWVKLDKDYVLTGANGDVTFAELFKGRSQLLVYHLMFGPGWSDPCVGCTQWANAFNGTAAYFSGADARLIAVSRAPYDEIVQQRDKLGWTFSWLSSYESEFNEDFYASAQDTSGDSTLTIGGEGSGEDGGEQVGFDRGENHGVSVFYRNDEGIFHTYSTYNRGIEAMNGAFGYFDLLPKGRPW